MRDGHTCLAAFQIGDASVEVSGTSASEVLEVSRELIPHLHGQEEVTAPRLVRSPEISRRIFIVHGHDDGPLQGAARFLERLGFAPVILREQANKGRTIITKFREEAAQVGFAIVLMTPDDHGAAVGSETKPRARQNVVFELGFFIGALGPDRVAALVKGTVERPSDLDGVVYISLDQGWKAELAKELGAAGFEINWNIVMGS